MDHLNLVGTVGKDQENDPADIRDAAESLTTLGIGRMDRAAQTGVWDSDFDGGVRSYQADNGLDVDGMLLPDGPTQRSINGALALTGERHATIATGSPDNGFEPLVGRWPTAFTAPPIENDRDGGDLESEARARHEGQMVARGYRYRPDPVGRLGEGDWFDGLGRPIGAAELRRIDREAEKPPAMPVLATSFLAPAVSDITSVGSFDSPRRQDFVVDGGKAFARGLIAATNPEDFEDPSIYIDALDALTEDADGVEPAGWRDDLRKLLEAMRRRAGAVPKPLPGPPRPPAGQPQLPGEITGRLQQILHPDVRTAANRLLDGARTAGWSPGKAISAEPAHLVKEGGTNAAWKDFGQFIGRTGGSRNDIRPSRDGKSFIYEAPDKTTITLYNASEGRPTNVLLIRLPAALKGQGRDRNLQIKIRYD